MAFPFNFNAPNPEPSGVQVESLTLPDLMKNPHVQAMYNSWQEASNQVVQSAQMQQTLWKENARLNAEVNSIQEKHQQDL